MLSYVHHTTPPPPGVQLAAGNVEYPGNTHHAVDLPFDRPRGELGKLHCGSERYRTPFGS